MTENTQVLLKVVYIMGTARSGTTILEILLSHAENTFGAGEITSLVNDGLIDNKACSCGNIFNECLVWTGVRKKLGLSRVKIKNWAQLQKKIDWHDGFLRQIFGLISKEKQQLYNRYNINLLDALRKTTGADNIIDSSKYVGRAYALSKLANIDLKIICLTRSPVGLMTSFQKPNKEEQQPKSIISTVIYYYYTMLTLRAVSFLLGNRVCCIQYESLLKAPDICIENIEKFTGLNLSLTRQILDEDSEFDIGHIVTGNRLRKRKTIRFERKSDSVPVFNRYQKIAISVMSLWKWVFRF